MLKKLYLLDGMALVYRAHFALIRRPIVTSKGINTSALYGFTQSMLDLVKTQQPTHLAAVFDTSAPTHRETQFPEYKAQREAMPEDIRSALPQVFRMLEAFRVPVISCDGYEADDLIGTLVRRAEAQSFVCYMVTADKDFGQLVSDKVFLYKPSRMGDGVEILGVPEILRKWGIQRPAQVIEILALMGDASDNIPGVPGIGEKTASALIAQYDTVENLLNHTDALKGKVKLAIETHREKALLSKKLATIDCHAPCDADFDQFIIRPPDDDKLKSLLVEFEFNALGRRLFGDDFKAGRGFVSEPTHSSTTGSAPEKINSGSPAPESDAVPATGVRSEDETPSPAPVQANLRTMADVPHDYRIVQTAQEQRTLVASLKKSSAFALAIATDAPDPKQANLLGIALSIAPHAGWFVPWPGPTSATEPASTWLRDLLETDSLLKVGHNLKFTLSVLARVGLSLRGKTFDTMLAHSLVEPDMRHSLEFVAESMLGYSPTTAAQIAQEQQSGELGLGMLTAEQQMQRAVEAADLAWQLRFLLEPLLKDKGQERVYYEVEAPLTSVLVRMESEGIRINGETLKEFASQLAKQITAEEREIWRLAGREFNVNSARQLGEILFEDLKLGDKPKKTRTGQYATDERTLAELAPDHEIVRRLLEFRSMTKLKSTYIDALPNAIWPKTGRVHTTFQQTATATGRLNSQDPNLQNIPIRTERGREIRKAFVPRNSDYLLLSADYSQIELRIIAALTQEPAMLEAFQQNIDIHTATAARVFRVALESVTSEMRRKAKMVNYGIAYGISAFGLAQRLTIPRREAALIMDEYFAQFPGIRRYMTHTIELAQQQGFVQTVTGRRRYIRDIRSANGTLRAAAERNAINAPIQGSAADMIKIAMVNIQSELDRRQLQTRMLLQVHDELLFDLYKPEESEVLPMVEEKMKSAIPLAVPIVVEMGLGANWLEAH